MMTMFSIYNMHVSANYFERSKQRPYLPVFHLVEKNSIAYIALFTIKCIVVLTIYTHIMGLTLVFHERRWLFILDYCKYVLLVQTLD